MSQLQLILVNGSPNAGNLVIYQQLNASQQVEALAWFSRYAYPSTQVSFSWDPADYAFVWSATGQFYPGVVFEVSQAVPANLTSKNQITLAYDSVNRSFYFKDQKAGSQSGNLTLVQDDTLPLNAASVGIGIAGRAIFAVQAVPGATMNFQPDLKYWVTFGTIQQGALFTISEQLTPVQVEFPANVNSMTVTLNADNTWTVKPNIMMASK